MAGTTQSCAIVRPDILGSVLLAALVVVTPALGGAVPIATRPAVPGSERVLRLPVEYNIGTLSVRPTSYQRSEEDGFHYWGEDADWQPICPLRGEVIFPAGQQVCLYLNGRSFSPLNRFGPDDVHAISFWKAGESSLTHITRLTGLKSLQFPRFFGPKANAPRFSPQSLKLLARCRSLERLDAPEGITDEGLAVIVEACPALRRLYFRANELTDTGIAAIARLQSLEELSIGGGRITAAGLEPLTRLASLRYLDLWGRFDDLVMPYARKMESLDTLKLSDQHITVVGLKQLAGHPRLRVLDLFNTDVSVDGFSSFKHLPALRKLNLGQRSRKVEGLDEGASILAALRDLEYLELPQGLTDEGIARLAPLSRLKHLRINSSSSAVLTDRSLDAVAKFRQLEYLGIGGTEFSDKGLEPITTLTKLKSLHLFFAPKVTNAGVARLASLKELQRIFLPVHGPVTVSGLNVLNKLPNLRFVQAGFISSRDEGQLNLSGLRHLEDVMLGGNLRDKEIATLRDVPRLKRLQLGRCPEFTDASLAHIAEHLGSITMLNVHETKCTDEGLARLAGMRLLSDLRLGGDFTDKGLRQLESMKDLQVLELTPRVPFSDEAVEHFRRAAPHVLLR